MKPSRAPRTRKRIACELTLGSDRYRGIALDVSASGLFVQTNMKPEPLSRVEVVLRLPGSGERLTLEARVARSKVVPIQLLTVAQGGVGLVIDDPPQAYLDFVAEVSPEQAEFAASEAGAASRRRSRGARNAAGRPGGAAGGGPSAPTRFRIHAVDTKSGRKNSFLVKGESEEHARAHVLAELGEDWQVLFVERV